jgi:hypothetical protein
MDLVAVSNTYPDLSFKMLDIYKGLKGAELLPPDAHFAYLNTLLPDSEPDVLFNIKMLEKIKRRNRPKKRWIPVLAALVLLLAGVMVYLGVQVYGVERDVKELNDFLNDPRLVAEVEEIEAIMADTARIGGLRASVDAQTAECDAKPQLSKQLIDTITRTAGTDVRITGFSFSSDSGTVSVAGVSESIHNASHYVELLSGNALIDHVQYAGYNTGGEGEFIFTIDIRAVAWREEAAD